MTRPHTVVLLGAAFCASLACSDGVRSRDAEADRSSPDLGIESGTGEAGCGPGLDACRNQDGTMSCVDLDSDGCHCGECGMDCVEGGPCVQGHCNGDCGGLVICGGFSVCGPIGSICSDPLRDEENCGVCGVVCSEGQGCADGECVPLTRP